MAKHLLLSLGCRIEEYDIEADEARHREMLTRTGGRTVPQVVIDGRPMGGYTDIARLHAAGELLPLLQGTPGR